MNSPTSKTHVAEETTTIEVPSSKMTETSKIIIDSWRKPFLRNFKKKPQSQAMNKLKPTMKIGCWNTKKPIKRPRHVWTLIIDNSSLYIVAKTLVFDLDETLVRA